MSASGASPNETQPDTVAARTNLTEKRFTLAQALVSLVTAIIGAAVAFHQALDVD
jgi:hypothetical protein